MGSRGPRMLVTLLLLATLTACAAVTGLASPTPAPTATPTTGDPQGTIRLAVAAVVDHDYETLRDLTCAQHRSSALGPFVGTGGLADFAAAGISEREAFAVVAITYADLSVDEVARQDKHATVHWTGTGIVTYDRDKFRALLKKVAKEQKINRTEAQIDAAVAALPDQQEQTFSSLIDLDKKGKAWLIC